MKTPREGAPFGCLSGAFLLRSVLLTRRSRRRAVSNKPYLWLAVLGASLACAAFAATDDPQTQKLDREYQSAVAQFEAGKYADAAARLETLLPHAPDSFAIHELLGLSYASLSQDTKAIEHLQAAVLLKPDSAEARTNLAATLSHSGKNELAGEQFRKALELEPKDYDANHNLGEFYIQAGKIAEAIPLLERAQSISPSYDNGYDLTQADLLTGRLDSARQTAQTLVRTKDTGELHNLLGQIEEKD